MTERSLAKKRSPATASALVADAAKTIIAAEAGVAMTVADLSGRLGDGFSVEQRTDAALSILKAVASELKQTDVASLADLTAWLVSIEPSARLARLLSTLDHPRDQHPMSPVLVLHIAAAANARVALTRIGTDFRDAAVGRLETAVLESWRRKRAKSPSGWLYHPRRPELSRVITDKFVTDLLEVSPRLRSDAETGRIVCDLNVSMTAGQRRKKLDLVIGFPKTVVGPAVDRRNPLRKSKVEQPVITLEVKACMTAHRQSTSRLLDELRSSLEVVKARNPQSIPVAIAIINVSPTFTNPLNLPGPNKHKRREIGNLFRRVVGQVHLDSGSGAESAYGGVGLVVVDTDNENRIAEVDGAGLVPPTHTYQRALGRAAELYARMSSSRR